MVRLLAEIGRQLLGARHSRDRPVGGAPKQEERRATLVVDDFQASRRRVQHEAPAPVGQAGHQRVRHDVQVRAVHKRLARVRLWWVLSVHPQLVSGCAQVTQTQAGLIPQLRATQPVRLSVSPCRFFG